MNEEIEKSENHRAGLLYIFLSLVMGVQSHIEPGAG